MLLQDIFVCLCLHKHTKVYYIKKIWVLQNTFVCLCLHKHTKVYYIKDSFLLMQHTFVCLCLHKHTKVCSIAAYLCLNMSHKLAALLLALAFPGLELVGPGWARGLGLARLQNQMAEHGEQAAEWNETISILSNITILLGTARQARSRG